MRSMTIRMSGFATACGVAATLYSCPASAAPWDKPGWTITFHDELDQGVLAPGAWGKRYKWGEAQINGELQAYIDDAFQFQGDVLRITGKHEQGQYAGETFQYTSGVIASVHEQKFGFFEIRCRMPKGQGLWPAFWLLGKVGADGVNEIDIHEFLGHEVDKVYMTIHWGPSYEQGHESDSTSYTGVDLTADFHTFAVEWETDHVTWFIDGQERFKHTGAGVPQVEMYAIANLAIGGSWPGAPDGTTEFPAYYDVDYVRIYERSAEDAGAPDASAQETGVQDGAPAIDAAGGDGAGAQDSAAAQDGAETGGAGAAGTVPPGPHEDDGGCGCRAVPARGSIAGLWWMLGALAARGSLRLRRRARSRPAASGRAWVAGGSGPISACRLRHPRG